MPTWTEAKPINVGAIPADNYNYTITGMSASTIYEYRAYMVVDGVPYYGNTRSTITLPIPTAPPALVTGVAYDINYNSMGICNNYLTDKGNLCVCEYGVLYTQSNSYVTEANMIYENANICKQSICSDIAISVNYFTGAGNLLTGLSPNTQTFYRAFAKNSAGTGYGTILSQLTPLP
jgi:hypothetical protein